MSLSEAMLDLAKEMEETDWDNHHSCPNQGIEHVVATWAKMLRMLAKTADQPQQESKPYDVRSDLAHKLASPSDVALAQRAVDRIHIRQRQISEIEEMALPRFACCIDGPERGTSIEIHPGAGEGSTVNVSGFAYALQANGTLKYKGDS